MKVFKLFLLLFICNNGFGQKNAICFLFNKGVVTYVDNTDNVHFAVSFKGDTVFPSKQYPNFYLIDTTLIQIHEYPITTKKIVYKYDLSHESKLLKQTEDYEYKYMKKEVYHHRLKCENILFKNNYSKQFLIWYFKVPDKAKSLTDVNLYNDPPGYKDYIVEYQLFLAFTTNNYVTMINIPVFSNEKLGRKVEIAMNDIANTVRIYAGDIDINMLSSQIEYNLKQKPLKIIDQDTRLELTIPYWLNIIKTDKLYLAGSFPDINNISNALLLRTFEKVNFDSFNTFENKMLLRKNIKVIEKLKSTNDKITRYKVFNQTSDGYLICQYVFLNMGEMYEFLDFGATENTYDKNISRFNEFVESLNFTPKK